MNNLLIIILIHIKRYIVLQIMVINKLSTNLRIVVENNKSLLDW